MRSKAERPAIRQRGCCRLVDYPPWSPLGVPDSSLGHGGAGMEGSGTRRLYIVFVPMVQNTADAHD